MIHAIMVWGVIITSVGFAIYSYEVLTDDPNGDRGRNAAIVQTSGDAFDDSVSAFRRNWAAGRKDEALLRFLAEQHKTASGWEHFLRPDGKAAVIEYRQALSALAIVVNDLKPGEDLSKFEAAARYVKITRPLAASHIKAPK